MSRFEIDPDTREPFVQEPLPVVQHVDYARTQQAAKNFPPLHRETGKRHQALDRTAEQPTPKRNQA